MKDNLIMTPENQQAFERSIDILENSIKEMRRVAYNMMPEVLVKFGLDTALKDFCNDMKLSGVININYQSIGLNDIPVPQTIAITVYRIVRELVNNIIKHAAASAAMVHVVKIENKFSLKVEDNGKGFDTSVLSVPKGIGWENIKSRVSFLSGKMNVQSTGGKGTSVIIEIDTEH